MLNELIIPAKDLAVVKGFEGSPNQLGYLLKKRSWDPKNPPQVAILGIPEGRGSVIPHVGDGADAIRGHLYRLASLPIEANIVDLGNIRYGTNVTDTYAAIKIVAEELASLGIRLLILGGSQELTLPIVLGFNRDEFNLIIVDDRIDNSEEDNVSADERYINNLPVGTSLTHIGGQSYFIGEQWHDVIGDGSDSDLLTLGEIRADYKEMEPLIRKGDLISFDYGAIKNSEAPGQYRISPNGLTGEEACQIAWYTGISTNPAWFALFGYCPVQDPTTTGAMMAAQISWYFINGTTKRVDEEPFEEATNFEHYRIQIDELEEPISFLIHPISKRWWMEVPSEDCTLFPVRIPCSERDYTKACKNEISEKWWRYFNKI